MSNIVKWTPNLAVTRRIEEALQAVDENVPAIRQEEDRLSLFSSGDRVVREAASQALPQRLAMPRACALVNRPYASYYLIGPDGAYRYSRSGQLNKASLRELFSGVGVGSYRMRAADIDEETCPWCGTSGNGAVHCPACNTFTCWGSVVDNCFWSCRASCGYSGKLARRAVEQIAMIPRTGF
jgi:hypothetical protein